MENYNEKQVILDKREYDDLMHKIETLSKENSAITDKLDCITLYRATYDCHYGGIFHTSARFTDRFEIKTSDEAVSIIASKLDEANKTIAKIHEEYKKELDKGKEFLESADEERIQLKREVSNLTQMNIFQFLKWRNHGTKRS